MNPNSFPSSRIGFARFLGCQLKLKALIVFSWPLYALMKLTSIIFLAYCFLKKFPFQFLTFWELVWSFQQGSAVTLYPRLRKWFFLHLEWSFSSIHHTASSGAVKKEGDTSLGSQISPINPSDQWSDRCPGQIALISSISVSTLYSYTFTTLNNYLISLNPIFFLGKIRQQDRFKTFL